MNESAPQVPEELMRELHRASEHFHECRKHLEEAMDAANYGHQARVDAAEEQLRQAEGDVEQIEMRIKKAISPQN